MKAVVQTVFDVYGPCPFINFSKSADSTAIEHITGRTYDEVAVDACQLLRDACGGFFRAMGAPNSMDIWRALGLPRAFEWRTLRRGQIEKLGTEESEPHRAPFDTWQLGYLVQALYDLLVRRSVSCLSAGTAAAGAAAAGTSAMAAPEAGPAAATAVDAGSLEAAAAMAM